MEVSITAKRPINSVQALQRLSTEQIVNEIQRHSVRCKSSCTAGAPCEVLDMVNFLPKPLLLKIQTMLASLMCEEQPRSPAYYSMLIQALALKASSLCLVRGCCCRGDHIAIKLHSIHEQLAFRDNSCNCSRCLLSKKYRTSIQYNFIQKNMFFFVNKTLQELHLGLVSDNIITYLPNFARLEKLSLIPTSNREAKNLSIYLEEFLRKLAANCMDLEDLSIECNPVFSFQIPSDAFKPIIRITKLKILYVVAEGISAHVATEVIHGLLNLEKVGFVSPCAKTCLFEEIHANLMFSYGYKQWPDTLTWLAPVNVLAASKTFLEDHLIFADQLRFYLFKDPTSEAVVAEEGRAMIEGDLDFYQTLTMERPVMTRFVPLCRVSGEVFTSVSLYLKNYAMPSKDITHVLASCPKLEKLSISVKSIKNNGFQLEERLFPNLNLRELEVMAWDRRNPVALFTVRYISILCPKIELMNIVLEQAQISTNGLSMIVPKTRPSMKTLYLSASRVRVTEEELAYLLEQLPNLKTLGYVNNWQLSPVVYAWQGFFQTPEISERNLKVLNCSSKFVNREGLIGS